MVFIFTFVYKYSFPLSFEMPDAEDEGKTAFAQTVESCFHFIINMVTF